MESPRERVFLCNELSAFGNQEDEVVAFKQPWMRLHRIIVTMCGMLMLAGLLLMGGGPDVRAVDAADKKQSTKKGLEKNVRKQTPVQVFMQSKLEDNTTILEGLMTNQFEQIVTASEHLSLMSTATEWHVIQGPIYKQHSEEFRRSVSELKKAAAKENLDGAALAYMHMTMTCINCHKFVRGSRIADGNVAPPIDEKAFALGRLEFPESAREEQN